MKFRSPRRLFVGGGVLVALVVSLAAAAFASAAPDASAPIKVMNIITVNTIAQNLPEEEAGAQAGVNYINAHGGINGHKIELTSCNDQYNPNQAATCAHQAVSDGDAVVIGSSVFSPEIIPVLSAAHIPIVGLQGANTIDYNDPDSYMYYSSAADWFLAMPSILKKMGDTKIANLVSNLPAVLTLAKLFAGPIDRLGLKDAGQIQAPNASTDYLPFAQAVKQSGANGVAMILQAAQIPAYFKAADQLGALDGINYIDLPGHYPPSVIQALGQSLISKMHLVLISPLPPVNATKKYPALKQYIAQMAALNKSTHMTGSNVLDQASLGAWVDTQILKAVLSKIKGPITGPSVIKQLDTVKNLSVAGFFYWTPSKPGPASEPHLSQHRIFLEVINSKGGIVSAPASLFKK